MNIDERSLVPGLDKQRADIIVAGGMLLETILFELGAEQITSCDWSLREGVILNYLRRFEMSEDDLYPSMGKVEIAVRTESILSVAKRYNYDPLHSRHVARLANQIFDETAELHNLGDEERRLLEYAAMLHDIGYYISHENHHRHGLYLIKNSEMPGFNSVEIAIIANMVRYLRGKMPKKDAEDRPRRKHKDFFDLDRSRRLIVRKLSAILRIADALDRSRRQTVRQIRCERANTDVTFYVESNDECDLELWMADLNADLFRNVFRVSVKFDHKLLA